jgi:hypothetical protein
MDFLLKKPPIGIMPKWLWFEFLEGNEPSETEIINRKKELESAILRYKKSIFKPLDEWFIELYSYHV